MFNDEIWMQHAMRLARYAASIDEIPVGAVIVYQNNCIAEGWNQSIGLNDATAHAEIMALRAAGKYLKNYRLLETTMYVTLEPCTMCVGALIHARVKKLVFGAYDYKTGAINSALQLLDNSIYNHKLNYQGGVLAETCGKYLSDFFRNKRISNHV
jgi:tRNA(adenine34) deaminase